MVRYFIWISLVLISIFSAFFGAVDINLHDLSNPDSLGYKIFFFIRLPRVVFAFFAGAILALGGLLFQTLFRNSLMTPYTLGISSGAVLGAGIAIKLGLGTLLFGFGAIEIFGFGGALFSVLLLLYLSYFLKGLGQNSLLLLGIALSFFYTSALMVVFYLGSAIQNDTLIRFTMGSLGVISWQKPVILGFCATFLSIVIYMYRFDLQLFAISSQHATLKGVNIKKTTTILLVVSSFTIGVLVSMSGPIGFVGLVIPHMVSRLYAQSINHLIIKTALFGGMFLIACDTLSRTLNTQSELPIGIITSLIGVPFFIYLLIKK